MKLRNTVTIVCLAVAFAMGAAWGVYGWLPGALAQGNGTAAAPDVTLTPPEVAGLPGGTIVNPVVSCTAQAYTTEMEEDPFDSTKIRRTRTKVTSIVVVYADGTTKTLKVN